ncbi:hypothetical protein BAZ12_18340 [Elizabethkingia miricola]|uniref:Uncharacterized protein n=1 Tax=Elizabethkingia miricola TaxID=172045 RepID=A0AAP1G3N5_ELIMR|nr:MULTISPECIES: hypothetical protein [Elizabethkingia]KUY17214.1 hypothetical protein ATB95_12625 [Elizabethkingia miricola]MCL1654501.1 hypothetical protein [Elizabethkingia miricola]OPC34625.1 hypothetical protein BAX99_07085 [Elizabethkingia miricola]OPC72240.1 hypothetical protein BAZ13_05915 [Elizabethkingia miricola]OPC75980.1 hypothetical protein BAZ12_18340 [Elizabethkingia miricola]
MKKRILLNLFIIAVVVSAIAGIKTVNMENYKNVGQTCFTINKYEAVGFENSLEFFEKIIRQYIVRWIEC